MGTGRGEHLKRTEDLLAEFNRQKAEMKGGVQPLARPEVPAPEPLDDKGKEHLVGLIFSSASGGDFHFVTVRKDTDGHLQVQCTCPAMMSISSRPRGCWAMTSARRVVGVPEVE